jgi:hypothetical protein
MAPSRHAEASRNRHHPDRPQQRSPPSDHYEEKKKKNEEPTTGRDGNNEHQQATWRDRPGGLTFHTLEALEASKKKGGRVKLKWRKDPL